MRWKTDVCSLIQIWAIRVSSTDLQPLRGASQVRQELATVPILQARLVDDAQKIRGSLLGLPLAGTGLVFDELSKHFLQVSLFPGGGCTDGQYLES